MATHSTSWACKHRANIAFPGYSLQSGWRGLTSLRSKEDHMTRQKTLGVTGICLLLCTISLGIHAQGELPSLATPQSEFKLMPLPPPAEPPQPFKTAEEHYNYLLKQANGGTRHTLTTLPNWEGLWSAGPNTIARTFLEQGGFSGTGTLRAGAGGVRKGVLTPAYEKQFVERRAEIDKAGQQVYDRLTRCEFPGMPRWIWEPYGKEFVHTPKQSWLLNDFMNETRRVYINGEHVNIDGKHSATGDSIGFWDRDTLIIWTKWINPADYTRGAPLTSNRLEMIETWQQVMGANGARQLVTQATMYDPVSLVKPVTIAYSHDYRPDLEKMGVRIRNWECSTSSNSYLGPDGTTHVYLPGDPEYKDVRGTTDFPDLPGQSLDPFNEVLP